MNFKDLSFRDKIDHIIYYYKWHIVLTIIGIISGISLIYTVFIKEPIVNYNGIAVYGEYLSFYKEDTLQEELAQLVEAPENYRILIDSYYSDDADPTVKSDLDQRFNTFLFNNQYQLIISTKENMELFVETEILYPIAAYLTQDEIAELEKYYELFYAVDPENNKEAAFAINISDSKLLKKYEMFVDKEAYIAFVPQPSEYTERTLNTLEEFLNR